MNVIVIETAAYYKLQEEQKNLIKQAIKEAKLEAIREASPANDWLDTEDAKKLLGVRSKSKMQKLRDNMEIVFTKHGRTIRYSKKSILKYLEKGKTC